MSRQLRVPLLLLLLLLACCLPPGLMTARAPCRASQLSDTPGPAVVQESECVNGKKEGMLGNGSIEEVSRQLQKERGRVSFD